jgi:MraZ protein
MEPTAQDISGSELDELSKFRGGHVAQVDEKFRLKIPADFKRQIDEFHGAKFYVTSKDGKRALIYPMKEWLKVEARLKGIASMNPGKQHFQRTTSYFGRTVEMDAQGRVLLPQVLREAANLVGEVTVLGMQEYLEVTNHEVLKTVIGPMTDVEQLALSELGL